MGINCVIYVLCLSSFYALWSPAGKGMTSWFLFVMFNSVLVTFLCGIQAQVRYFIVLIPDLCRISYFKVADTLHNLNFSLPVCILGGGMLQTVDNSNRCSTCKHIQCPFISSMYVNI